jgi:hypothetical protein
MNSWIKLWVPKMEGVVRTSGQTIPGAERDILERKGRAKWRKNAAILDCIWLF